MKELPVREADLSSLSAPTQETGMLGVRTTHASLQFIILWGRDQLPRRQLRIARDPDIKPHCDCCMKKHYHLATNIIMLRERESASKGEIAGASEHLWGGNKSNVSRRASQCFVTPIENWWAPQIVSSIWSSAFIVSDTMSSDWSERPTNADKLKTSLWQ